MPGLDVKQGKGNFARIVSSKLANDHSVDRSRIELLSEKFSQGDFKFVPMVTREEQLVCSLDVLFLRPGMPGGAVQSGDIDNRLKTVFDALRIAQNESELAGSAPLEGEQPFFCLLEDDSLIEKVSVESDLLLEPIGELFAPNDARLVISVSVRPTIVTYDNLRFAS